MSLHAFVRARLVKRSTDDGLVEFNDDVPIGRIYEVDPETRRVEKMFNLERRQAHFKEVVTARDGGYLPVECLELQVN